MNISGGTIRTSASDLANHLACTHLTSLDLAVARGEQAAPDWVDPAIAVLQQLGFEHEQAYLDHLRGEGRSVSTFDSEEGDSETGFERTVAAMRSGAEVIFQATLRHQNSFGRADILLRVASSSGLGEWSYEVVDCKLARETRAGTTLSLDLLKLECRSKP